MSDRGFLICNSIFLHIHRIYNIIKPYNSYTTLFFVKLTPHLPFASDRTVRGAETDDYPVGGLPEVHAQVGQDHGTCPVRERRHLLGLHWHGRGGRQRRRTVARAPLVESHVLRRSLVEEAVRDVDGLEHTLPRAARRLVPQQRGESERAGRCGRHMEHQVQEADARGRVPLPERRRVHVLRQVPPEPDPRRHLLRTDCALGHTRAEADARAKDSAQCYGAHGELWDYYYWHKRNFLKVCILETKMVIFHINWIS